MKKKFGLEPFLISSKTNVYGVANVVATAMVQVIGMEYFYNLEIEPGAEPDFPKKDAPFYSRALRNLLSDCMRWNPSDRLTLEQVLTRIKANRNSNQVDLRNLPSNDPSWNEYLLVHDCIHEVRTFSY